LAEFSECSIAPYDIIDAPEKVAQEWTDTIFAIHRFAITLEEPPIKEVEEKFPFAFAKLNHFYWYFSTPKWRLWRRHRLIRRIKSTDESQSDL
jgi:hypothetical protein